MVLLPRVINILVEGLIPFSEAMKAFVEKRLPGRSFFMGLDLAVMVGDPMNLTIAILMFPISILIALILPGNKVLPLVDLASMPFFTAWAVATSKGRFTRSLIVSIITIIFMLYGSTLISPIYSDVVKIIGTPAIDGPVASLGAGNPLYVSLLSILSIFHR